ncbi:PilZ domain-containing protein [Lichenifustis flavocetrariae]|uniref:PilZ domain-containing protein n=1 Tax=Lichenifustis flavocetrariae TaxID=2949735 RepID=UPI003D0C470A
MTNNAWGRFMISERREKSRRSVSVPATVESGRAKVSGIVLDVSASGARVRLTSCAFLLDTCTLTSSIFASTISSRIVWRRGTEIGLCFKSMVPHRDRLSANPTGAGASGWFGRRR